MDNTEKEYIEKHSNKYLRVGTQYYKIVHVPDAYGGKNKTRLLWNRSTITADYGKKVLDNIKKFDGFVCIPDHLNYKQEIDDFYNEYNPLPVTIHDAGAYDLKELEVLIPTTLGFMAHIFGEQLDLGLDYLKILVEKPTQILPILSLVSSERSTGKSTFLKWIRVLFGLNMTYVKGDSFSSQFNADWGGKLLVAIDEVFFEKKEITERLKFLSTATSDKVEAKGQDRKEMASFYKFLLCSNNETSFLIIDEKETRIWVRKISPLRKEDVNFLNKLEKEAPYFLRYLLERSYFTEKKTRMWFTPDQIWTDALEKLKRRNNNKLESQLIAVLYEIFYESELEEIKGIPQDFLNMIKKNHNNVHYLPNDIRKILKNNWKLEPQKNGLIYNQLVLDYSGKYTSIKTTGRYYTIEKKNIDEMFVEFVESVE